MSALQERQQLSQARMRMQAGDLASAETLCRQVLASNKRSGEALHLLGQVAHQRGRFDDAAEFFQKYVRLQPRDAAAHLALATVRWSQGRFNEAISRYDRALKIKPGWANALAGKAQIHIARGEYDRARRIAETAIDRHGDDPMLLMALCEACFRGGDGETAVEIGRRARCGDALAAPMQYRLGSLLGRACERAGDYDGAFEAYTWARQGFNLAFDRGAYAETIDQIIDVFSADALNAMPRATIDASPAVFIISMPRAGSTLTEGIIDAHSQAFGAGETDAMACMLDTIAMDIQSTEPYPRCMRDADQTDVDQLAGRYLQALHGLAPRAQRIVNKHLLNPQLMGLIAMLCPDATLIECRRDPLDLCFSCYSEPLNPVAHPYVLDLRDLGFAYRQHERLMAHWRRVLPGAVLTVQYEELVSGPEPVTRRIIEHCGLPWEDRCLRFHESSRPVVTLSFAQVRQPIYQSSVGRAQRFKAHLEPLHEALSATD